MGQVIPFVFSKLRLWLSGICATRADKTLGKRLFLQRDANSQWCNNDKKISKSWNTQWTVTMVKRPQRLLLPCALDACPERWFWCVPQALLPLQIFNTRKMNYFLIYQFIVWWLTVPQLTMEFCEWNDTRVRLATMSFKTIYLPIARLFSEYLLYKKTRIDRLWWLRVFFSTLQLLHWY